LNTYKVPPLQDIFSDIFSALYYMKLNVIAGS